VKLALSNIAWEPSEDEAVARVLLDHGFQGVEIAPTKVWPKPLESTRDDRAAYRRQWEERGLRIVAMQSLLFGHPEFKLFEDPASRAPMATYLKAIIDLAADLGAGALVFGSPGNRKRGSMPEAEAFEIATSFFRDLGRHAASAGVTFCIEPNPPAYGCDFVQTSTEGAALVQAVDSVGFGLHLDAAGMRLAGEEPHIAAGTQFDLIRHFHVSAPQLGPVGSGDVGWYEPIATTLRDRGYARWVSVEMRAGPAGASNLARVTAAAQYCSAVFG
jgi:D-psicose/D-tagatose/L-ribulose 3-epimerase